MEVSKIFSWSAAFFENQNIIALVSFFISETLFGMLNLLETLAQTTWKAAADANMIKS